MKNKNLITGLLGLMPILGMAQVGINTNNPVVSLHIEPSSKTNPQSTDGILIPKVKNFPTENPTVKGVLVFLEGNDQLPDNFYFWDGSKWVPFYGNVNKTIDETIYSFNGTGNTDSTTLKGYLKFTRFHKKSSDGFSIQNDRNIIIGKNGVYLVQLYTSMTRTIPGVPPEATNINYKININDVPIKEASNGYPLEYTSATNTSIGFIRRLNEGDIINVSYEGTTGATGNYSYAPYGNHNMILTYIKD